MGQADINRVAEMVLIPLFAEVWGYKKLKNLNLEQTNFPGVDLGDKEARVAIQVTSTPDSEKVKETLRKFIQYKLYQQFDRVIVYVITEKQASYTGRGYAEITRPHITFDKQRDIVDWRDLLKTVDSFQLDKLQRIEATLEANFGSGHTMVFGEAPPVKVETLYLNLLEMSFPEKLYVADLRPDLGREARDLEAARRKNRSESGFKAKRRKRLPGARERVRQYLSTHDRRFATDWECHSGQILTFHDLNDEDVALRLAINTESITDLHPEEFYGQSAAQENVFRTLLGRCLQQKLYHLGVSWQQDEGLFFFTGKEDEDERREKWKFKKKNERGVYWRVMDKKQPDKVWYRKHFAFQAGQMRFGEQWYLMIKPDWFFSYDGYKTSFLHAEKVTWLKNQKERNSQVFNHFQFIVHLLTHDKPSTLFESAHPYRFLTFGKTVSFDSAPAVDDKEWLRGESPEERQKLTDVEEDTLSLDLDD